MAPIPRPPRHLYQRGATYYFRLSLPKDCRRAFGQHELRASLHTNDLRLARGIARLISQEAKQIIRMVRQGTPSMNRATLQDLIADMWKRYIHSSDTTEIVNAPALPDVQRYIPNITEAYLEKMKRLLAEKPADELRPYGRLLMKCIDSSLFQTLHEDDIPEAELFLGFETIKNIALHLEILCRRAAGDYGYERTVLPQGPVEIQTPIIQTVSTAPKPGIPLSQAIEKFLADKRENKKHNRGVADDYRSILKKLIDICGDIPVSDIDRDKMRFFRKALMGLPKRWNVDKRFKHKTIEELLALNSPETVSDRTVNNVLTVVAVFLNWCAGEGYMQPAKISDFQIKINKREDEERDPFDCDDLVKIFYSKQYYNDTQKTASSFWMPLISLFSGLRREEVAQLHIEDIRCEQGIWIFDINDNPNSAGEVVKKLKTKAARRLVPIHAFLLHDLNFTAFMKKVKADGHERLFPNLNKVSDNFGHTAGNLFSKFKFQLGLSGKKDFHSFRHTFSHYFKINKLNGEVFEYIFGHELSKMSSRRYGAAFPPKMCLDEVISKLDYGIDLSHLKRSKHVIKS